MFAYFEWLLLALPLVGASVNVLAGERLSRRMQDLVAMVGVTGSLLVMLPLAIGVVIDPSLVGRPAPVPWIRVWSGARFVEAEYGLRLDALSIVLAAALLCGAWFVHLHAIRGLAPSPVRPTVLARLNGALCAGLCVLLADNMLFLLLGWSLAGWFTYGVLCAAHSSSSKPERREHWLALGFWVASDLLLLVAVAVIGRRFASLSLDDLTALAPAPGLKQVPARSLAVAGALICGSVLLRVGVFPFGVPLPPSSASWGEAMARGLTTLLPGLYLIARLYPMLESVPVLSAVIAWWGALSALLNGLRALVQPNGQGSTRSGLLSQGGLLLLAIGTGSLPAAVVFLPVCALLQALVLLGSDVAPLTTGSTSSSPKAAWVTALGLAWLLGLPPLGAFSFHAQLLQALFRTDGILWALLLVSLLVLAAGGARAIRSLRGRGGGPHRFGALWVLAAVVAVLGLSSLASPPVLIQLLAPTTGHALDRPTWWWFALVAAISAAGALVGYWPGMRMARLQNGFAGRIAGAYAAERVWERAVVHPLLVAGAFLTREVEPRLARSSLGLLARWSTTAGQEEPLQERLPHLLVLFLLATAAILIYLILAR